jgi:hypothetical protein
MILCEGGGKASAILELHFIGFFFWVCSATALQKLAPIHMYSQTRVIAIHICGGFPAMTSLLVVVGVNVYTSYEWRW